MEASNGIAFAQPSLDYVPFSQHKFAMRRVSFQLGLSELPVPLLDVYLEDSKLNVEKFGERSVISSLIEIGVTHWNMAIGRWEPILEKTVIDITLRLSPKERYVMVSVS